MSAFTQIPTIEGVADFIRPIFLRHYADGDSTVIQDILADIRNLFEGQFVGYQRCDTPYHNFAHTLQVTMTQAQLLDGINLSHPDNALRGREFQLGIIAMLLHDTGYIKKDGDAEGSGAKYTFIHVARSIQFAEVFLAKRGFDMSEIGAVRNMIQCTNAQVRTRDIPFATARERLLGCAVGTADLLGQMAHPDYPQKIPALFLEFTEAATHPEIAPIPIPLPASAEELMRGTTTFYRDKVLQMLLPTEWHSAHAYLEMPLRSGRNPYLDAIEKNLKVIDSLLPATKVRV